MKSRFQTQVLCLILHVAHPSPKMVPEDREEGDHIHLHIGHQGCFILSVPGEQNFTGYDTLLQTFTTRIMGMNALAFSLHGERPSTPQGKRVWTQCLRVDMHYAIHYK